MRVSFRDGCSVSQLNQFSLSEELSVQSEIKTWRKNVREMMMRKSFRGVGCKEPVHSSRGCQRRVASGECRCQSKSLGNRALVNQVGIYSGTGVQCGDSRFTKLQV